MPCIPVKIVGDAGLLDGGYAANKRAVENSSSVSFIVVSPGDDERDRLVRPTMKYLRIGLALPCSLVHRQCLHVCAKLLGKGEVGTQEPIEVEQLL